MTGSGTTTLRHVHHRWLVLLLFVVVRADAYDWLQLNGDAAHSGYNANETTLRASNVAQLVQRFQATLPAQADGAPVFLESVATAAGTKDLVFVTTVAGHIVAVDAQTGAIVWSRQYDPGSCRVNQSGGACYTTSSPALDPNRQFVYTYGLDGQVHKLRVGDGSEIIGGGWPQLTTTKGFDEKGSSALVLATADARTYLYVAHGGYPGDGGDYQGHLTTIDLGSGLQIVFNVLCSSQSRHFVTGSGNPNCAAKRGAIWSRPAVVYDAAINRIFVATGNGIYDGGTNWGDSVLALNVDGSGVSGRPLDAYTPANQDTLGASDADLGSVAPALLPVPPSSRIAHLAAQGGKDGKLRLLDLANLSGRGGPGFLGGEIGAVSSLPQGGPLLAQPAVWVNPVDGATWMYVVNDSGIAGLKLSIDGAGNPSLVAQWQRSEGGFSPLVAGDVLYYAGSWALRALDPLTGRPLWSAPIGGIHWKSPVVANGMVYVTDDAPHLTAFGLPAGAAPVRAIEYYNKSLDHYFITPLSSEIGLLDTTRLPGWERTGQSFFVSAESNAGAAPVCRFYIPPLYGDSHFYSASLAECAIVLATYPYFVYESPALFYMGAPDPITGACSSGRSAVYRVWNKRLDTNHRYMLDRAIRDQMITRGWVPEGYGPDAVIMCAPL